MLPMLPVPGSVNIYAGAIPGIFVTKDLEYYLESYDTQLRGPGQVGGQKAPLPVMVLDPAAVPSQVAVRSDPADATLVIDEVDADLADAVEAEGVRCIVTPTVMSDPAIAAALATTCVQAATGGPT